MTAMGITVNSRKTVVSRIDFPVWVVDLECRRKWDGFHCFCSWRLVQQSVFHDGMLTPLLPG